MIANNVPEMSVKLKFQIARFEKKHCFALVVLNWFPIRFYQGLFTRCDFCNTVLLQYYAQTKEIIYESVNLKGVVYAPKQKSFSLQSITTSKASGRLALQMQGLSFLGKLDFRVYIKMAVRKY